MPTSDQQHQRQAAAVTARCAIITLSDTRTRDTDASGQRISALLIEAGHAVAAYEIIPDEPRRLDALLDQLLDRDDVDAILTTGGTGISRRDQTPEVIARRLDQTLPGFAELFRMLSWEQVGSAAMLSRAIGGVARGKIVLAMPGSLAAVELAMKRLVIPELRHMLHQTQK